MDEISEIDIGIWHILSSLWFLFTKRGTITLGILSSQDGNAEVDIKRKKIMLNFKSEFCKWLDVFTVSYSATSLIQHNKCERR